MFSRGRVSRSLVGGIPSLVSVQVFNQQLGHLNYCTDDGAHQIVSVLSGGFPSSILQEVNVTVFSSSQCDRSYSSLTSYATTWPQGIGQETLCAGDPNGGRDACQVMLSSKWQRESMMTDIQHCILGRRSAVTVDPGSSFSS